MANGIKEKTSIKIKDELDTSLKFTIVVGIICAFLVWLIFATLSITST